MVVRLDPWQEIVNVGWGVRYIAVRTQVTYTSERDSQECPVSLGEPPSDHHPVYVTESGFEYDGESVVQTLVFKSSGWESPDEAVVVSGMPTLPGGGASYDPYEWMASGSAHPRAGWQIPTAATLDVNEPSFGSPFYDVLSATVEMRAPHFTGSPTGCYQSLASPTAFLFAPHTPDPVGFSPHVMSFSGVTAIYKGRNYHAAGLHVRNSGGVLTEPGTAWILCERDPA